MSMKGTLIAVIPTTLILWCLSGVYHMLLVADMEKEYYMIFQSLSYPESEMPGVGLWLIPLMLVMWFVLYVLTRGSSALTVASGAKTGALVCFILAFYMEFGMHMWFKGLSMSMSALGIGWETLQGAIGGALLAMLYTRFNK